MDTPTRFSKNHSNNSTHYMTTNYSNQPLIFFKKRPRTATSANYATIKIPKEKIKWNQSASTWRQGQRSHSFSKNKRFKDEPAYYTDIIQPQIPTTLTSKTCTFGKGDRRPIDKQILRNAKEKPAPDRYELKGFDEQPRKISKGKTFGLGWGAYQRNFISHRSDVYAAFQTQDNPSAKYQMREQPGSNTQKFTAYGRLKMYTQKMAQDRSWVPGPYHHVKERHLSGTIGMTDRNFGFGDRIDLSASMNDNPEAIYMIPGFCDVFRKVGKKTGAIKYDI